MTDAEHEVEMVLAYVPEAKYISWARASYLAKRRDSVAAKDLERSYYDAMTPLTAHDKSYITKEM